MEREAPVCGLIPGVRGVREIRRSAAIAACALFVAAGCGGGDEPAETTEEAAPAEPELALEEVGEFEEPIALTGAQDGALYIGERAGVVRRMDAPGEKAEVVLDISADVSTEGEGGLLSLAHSPEGDEIFVTYAGRDKKLHLEGFAPGESEADAQKSRRELFAVDHPNEVHWGGHLDFDDDGRLYLSTGEGGPVAPRPLVSQDPDSPLGKLFRLDPDADEPEPELIALGLRNPWQFSIDGTDIWIGDVGDFQQEEVDLASTEMEGAAELRLAGPRGHGRDRGRGQGRAPGGSGAHVRAHRQARRPELRDHRRPRRPRPGAGAARRPLHLRRLLPRRDRVREAVGGGPRRAGADGA